jgi:Mg-chelatase subunit ChlD
MFTARISPERGSRSLAALALTLAVLLPPGSATAQQPDCPRRTVLVNVLDRDGMTLGGLTPASFAAKFGGKSLPMVALRDRTLAPRIVVVLDTSGSMYPRDSMLPWRVASATAAHLFVSLGESHACALVLFNDKVTHELPFGTPQSELTSFLHSKLEANVARKELKGRTALFSAILRALEMLNPAQPGDVIFAITDGGENASRVSYKKTEQALLAARVRFFAAAISAAPFGRGIPEEQQGPTLLRDLSRATGGGLIHVSNPVFQSPAPTSISREVVEEINTGLYALYRHMREVYELEIELPWEITKPEKWNLKFRPEPGISSRRFTVHYLRKLVPCGKP